MLKGYFSSKQNCLKTKFKIKFSLASFSFIIIIIVIIIIVIIIIIIIIIITTFIIIIITIIIIYSLKNNSDKYTKQKVN